MTATTSRVKVKAPKSGSERLELVLLESDNSINKASIPSLPSPTNMLHTQPTPQPTTPTQPSYQSTTITALETRNDNNTTNYLPNQYNNSTNTNTNNIDDNSSYLTGCSASTAETDNRASAYRNNDDSSERSWSREYTDVNTANANDRGVRDGREGVGESGVQGRENEDDESDLYGSLEQCESIVNINDVLSNTGGVEGVVSRSGSPTNSEPAVVAKDEQPAAVVVKAVNTAAAAVESEEESSSQQPSHPQQPIQSSPTNLQYKKSVSFDQSLDELLTSATTTSTSEEEDQSSASSSAASDKKKKSKKKKGKKKKGSDGSVKSEDTSVESVGYKVKTTFGNSGKKKSISSNPKQQEETATPSKSASIEEEEDSENNPSFSSQQQQKKKNSNNRRKSAPKVLRVSKYSKQKSTSSSSVTSKVGDASTASNGPVDVDKVETQSTTKSSNKGKSKDKKTNSSTTRTTNDVESACSVVTEPLLDVLMREEQQHQQQQSVNKEEDIPEVVQEQEKSATRRELRKQRSSRIAGSDEVLHDDGDQQQYGQQQQQQPRLQHRRTLPRDHPNYQSSQRSDQYNNQYRDDTNSSIQRSNSNISNTTSLYSAYSNVALDGYVEPTTNSTNNSRRKKKKEKKEKKGIFRKTARVAIKSVKGSKKLGMQFMKKVKDWYDDNDEEEYDVDDYGASVVMTEYDYGNEYKRRDQENGRAAQYSFEGYDHLKSPRNSPRGGSKPHPTVPSHQGNGTMANPWTEIGGPQEQQGSQKEVTPNFANNINPWSGIQTSSPQADDNQQHGEYNQDGMPSIKWWTWKQKEKRPVATAAAADDEAEDETSNESMEYTYFAFLSKVKAS